MASITQGSVVLLLVLFCGAGEPRLTGLLETHGDFPQEVKYVSISGPIARVKDTKSLIGRAGQ